MNDQNDNRFYVYAHTRLDSGKVFYIGKGCGKRSKKAHGRNQHWGRVAKKHGFSVFYLAECIDEEFAILCEIEAIDVYLKRGFELCNKTNGGEGVSGYSHTEETKAAVSAKLKGRVFSEETLQKIGDALKGRKFSEETIRRMSEAGKKQSAERSARLLGGNSPALRDEVRKKISETLKGKKQSEETKEKTRQRMLKDNPAKRDDVREKIRLKKIEYWKNKKL